MTPKPIGFTFNGRELTGREGDSIATALLRNKIRIFDRSIKRRRKRGPGCLAGFCMNCLLEVNGAPNVVSCRTPLREGSDVRSQVARPAPARDVEAPIRRLAFRVFGDDLYYRLFTQQSWARNSWIAFLSRTAGRGRLAFDAESPEPLPFNTIETDVLVVGAGVAGIASANQARQNGARVLLLDRGPKPGGWRARWRALGIKPEPQGLDGLLEAVAPEVQLLPETTLIALYEDNSALALGAATAYRIHYDVVVLATGCYPRLLAFPGSDEPLHIPVQGLVRAALETGWAPASVALLEVGDPDAPWAEALTSLDVAVQRNAIRTRSAPIIEGIRAHSQGRHSSVKLSTGEVVTGEVVSWSAGWRPREELVRQAGGSVVYDPTRDSFLPQRSRHVFAAKNVLVAGGCAGIVGFDLARQHGQLAGAAAMMQLGGRDEEENFHTLVENWEHTRHQEGD